MGCLSDKKIFIFYCINIKIFIIKVINSTMELLNFKNKPLTIVKNSENKIHIGDYSGNLFLYDNCKLKLIKNFVNPISGITFIKSDFYVCDWRGNVYSENKSVKLSNDICKSICSSDNEIFVSSGAYIFILSTDLEIIKQIRLDNNVSLATNKAICMDFFEGALYCGLSVPGILKITKDDEKKFITEKLNTSHTSNILKIKILRENNKIKIYTISADCSARVNDLLIYENENMWPNYIDDNIICFKNEIYYIKEKRSQKIRYPLISAVEVNKDYIFITEDRKLVSLNDNEDLNCSSDEEFLKTLKN